MTTPIRPGDRLSLPAGPRGYEVVDPRCWSIILPYATQNLIINPSMERDLVTATSAYTGVSATLAWSLGGRRGRYNITCTATAATGVFGVSYADTGFSCTTGQTYTFSADVRDPRGSAMELRVLVGARQIAAQTFRGIDYWQRPSITFTATSTAAHTFRVVSTSAGMTAAERIFYTDGWQVENLPFPTTYCDGDQAGLLVNQIPSPYRWEGAPHASTSVREITTRAGGRVVRFADLGFHLTAVQGLGSAPMQVSSTEYALIDGSRYQDTRIASRSLTFVGIQYGTSPSELFQHYGDLISLVQPTTTAPRAQMHRIIYQYYQACDETPSGEEVVLDVSCQGGLEGTGDSLTDIASSLQFVIHNPHLVGTRTYASALSYAQTVANANNIYGRNAAGTLTVMNTGIVGTLGPVHMEAYNADELTVCGHFTSAGGVANTRGVARYNQRTNTWSAYHTGLTGAATNLALKFAIDANKDFYIVGNFSDASGVADTLRVAKWNWATNTFTALGAASGANALVVDCALHPNGNLYISGSFTLVHGVAANYVAAYDPVAGTWAAIGTTGVAGNNYLAISPGGTVYITGASSPASVFRWNGVTTWTNIGTAGGAIPTISGLHAGPDNRIYATGPFTTMGGVAASNIAVWNGSAWSQVGDGLVASAPSAGVIKMYHDAAGVLYLAGDVVRTASTTVNWLDMLIRFNGAVFVRPGLRTTANPTAATAYYPAPDGSQWVGFNNAAALTAESGVITTVTVAGASPVHPTFTIVGTSGPGELVSIENRTTRQALYFGNYTIQTGETVTITTMPGNLSVLSSFIGNISQILLPGSDTRDFILVPGSNSLDVFVADAAGAVTATVSWQPEYASLAEAADSFRSY